MAIVVLPRIEIDNPFGTLSEILQNEAIPLVKQLAMNKEQIAILSDTELTDHIPILKRFAPELLTQNNKINWNKVEEYLQSDDLFKQEVANYLINARKSREEFANLPIGVKLEKLGFYSAKSNPQILKKNFMVRIISEKYQEMIKNSNLSEDAKLFLLAHVPEFAEKAVQNPAYFTAFLKILNKHSKQQNITQQEDKTETKQDNKADSWQLDLDGQQKKFGIRLEEPKLTFPQITFSQVNPLQTHKKVITKKQKIEAEPKNQSAFQKPIQSDIISTFWFDGVKWGVRKKKDGSFEYVLLGEAPLVEQEADPFGVSLAGRFLSKTFKLPKPPLPSSPASTKTTSIRNLTNATSLKGLPAPQSIEGKVIDNTPITKMQNLKELSPPTVKGELIRPLPILKGKETTLQKYKKKKSNK